MTNYHDNRAFQYHNNILVHSGKYANDGELDVVIVQKEQRHLCNRNNNNSSKPLAPYSAIHRSISGVGTTCRRHQRPKTTTRQCNNATQTPDATLQSSDWRQYNNNCASKPPVCCHCCSHSQENCCHNTAGDSAAHSASCFQPLHPRSTRSGVISSNAISADAAADITCHCHITHHCHQHYSHQRAGGGGDSSCLPLDRRRHQKRRREHCTRRKLYRQPHQQLHLPVSTTKSSLSSDDQLGDHQHRQRRRHLSPRVKSTQTHEIAIEIDAASTTLTEENHSACNSSTGTSNFSYKLANDNYSEQQPIAHDKTLCRSSMISNTTLETSELTAEDSGNDAAELQHMRTDRQYVGESPAADDDSSTPPPVICCEDPQCCRVVAASNLQNSSVKIKRKRFISQQYCSSCSKCSSCSCQLHTSSCSSFEDFEVDGQELEGSRKAHEFIVAADCHRCQLQRQSTNSTADGADDEDEAVQKSSAPAKTSLHRDNESARSSRRSSGETFCSCNSTTCCYCSCDECDASHARPPGTNADADQHSSTLTPITQPSTPLADDDDAPTLRSNSTGLGEDTASLSQSAEYFSLSSNHQSLQQQLAVTVLPATTTPRKQCKHYSKHHRHKHDLPPVDNSL